MAKNIFFWSFALFLIVQTSIVFSFDCNTVSPQSYPTCLEISSMNINQSEKDLILSNLDYSKKFYPDHSFVYQRNTNLQINDAPYGYQKQNGIFVRNAWLSLLTAMPSVIYNNNTYVNQTAKALCKYNYGTQIPSNYYSPRYPYTNNGDCKRIYTVTTNTAVNRVYLNTAYQGSGSLVNLNINSDGNLMSKYSINLAVDIDHYVWNTYCCQTEDYCAEYKEERYCCKRKNGKCTRHCYRDVCVDWEIRCIKDCHDCVYDHDETQADNMLLTDSIPIKRYNNNLFANLNVVNSYGDSTVFKLNYSNSVELSFQDSLYQSHQFVYDINYSKKPYYIYTLKAYDYNQEKMQNMIKDNQNLIVKNTANCKIKSFDFFNIFQSNCNLASDNIDLSISTDKLSYKENETIQISIIPSNIIVKISYANETKNAQGNTSFTAKHLQNRITADYKAVKAEKIIFVESESKFALLWNFSVFGFLNYFFYVALKKYWGNAL
jgi:hypothetical protein